MVGWPYPALIDRHLDGENRKMRELGEAKSAGLGAFSPGRRPSAPRSFSLSLFVGMCVVCGDRICIDSWCFDGGDDEGRMGSPVVRDSLSTAGYC